MMTKERERMYIMSREYIVFVGEHYNPLGLIRSLGENGISPIGIIIKSSRRIASRSKYLKKIHFVASIEEGYNLLIEKYANNSEKHYLFSCDDKIAYYLDQRYNELITSFFFFNGNGAGKLSYYMDKYNICQLASKHGIPLAKTWIVPKGDIPEDLTYPIITKAGISTIDNWKGDSYICQREEELVEAYKHIRSENVILQQYIEKKNELCLDGCCFDHGNKTVISIASTYNYILPDTYSPYMTVTTFDAPELSKKISEMFKEIQFEGIFSMEFLIGHNDEMYFLEINFRNSTWSYASTVAGMALPVIWSEGMSGKLNADSCVKLFNPFNAMVEFDDFNNRVKTRQMNIFKWLYEVFNCKCKYYFSLNDILPFLSVVLSKFGKIFRKVPLR